MESLPSSNVRFTKLEQFAKALWPIDATVFGTSKFVSFVQLLNVSSGIDVKLGSFFGKILPSKLVLKILYEVEHKKRG